MAIITEKDLEKAMGRLEAEDMPKPQPPMKAAPILHPRCTFSTNLSRNRWLKGNRSQRVLLGNHKYLRQNNGFREQSESSSTVKTIINLV